MKRWTPFLVIGGFLCCGVPAAHAHVKDYLVNQDYYTASRGEFEVGFWNDMNFTTARNDNTYNSQHQIELEYGLLEHLQLAYYEVYTWDREKDWARDAFKVETKCRLAEAGQWPLDIAFYMEYENPNGPRRAHSDELENKVILSRDFGRWDLITNLIFVKELNSGHPWECSYTAGVSYGLTSRTRVGLELKQDLGDAEHFTFDATQPLYVVPGVYTSLTPHVRVLAGPAFGLTKTSDDLQLKSVVEVEF